MKKDPPTIAELLNQGTHYLRDRGSNTSRLDAELLMSHLLNKSREELFLQVEAGTSEAITSQYQEFLAKRGDAIPVAYLLGEKEFMSLPFKVDSSVLIPRPETEGLVEKIIEVFKDSQSEAIGIDIGTGSGCIAISICHYLSNVKMFATDLSLPALRIAQTNSQNLGTEERITFFQSELYGGFGFHKIAQGTIDFIVSNPPYIPRGEIKALMKDVLREPHQALDGGNDGLEFYRRLIPGAPFYLKNGGILVLEIGNQQQEEVEAIFDTCGRFKAPEFFTDLAGHTRVVTAEKKNG